MVNELKSKYSIGMLADQFVNYVRRFKQKEESTMGVDFGIQEDIGLKILESLKNIKSKISEYKQLDMESRLFSASANSASANSASANFKSLSTNELRNIRLKYYENK